MKSTFNIWPYIAVVGMTLSLFGLFSISYFLAYTLASSRNPLLISFGNTLLTALKTFWFPMLLVSLNIALWAVISYWRIGEGDLIFNPFTFRGFRTELLAFSLAFLGLWILRASVRFLGLNIHTFSPKRWTLFWAFEHAIFGSLEEITWRAYVLNAIGGVWGLIISSFGFGLHHLGSSWQHALYAFVAGLIIGGVYMNTGAFWGVFFAHGFYNFTAILGEILTSKGG